MTFDRVASVYRFCETIVFGRALQRARVRWLKEIGSPSQVLICGEGDGRFLEELRQLYPNADIDCVDSSEKMLELAKARTQFGNVNFIQADVRGWVPRKSYDLIVTHFLLDCFEGEVLNVVVRKLAHGAAPNAIWLLSDFRIPERGFARFCPKLLVQTMYAFFRATCGLQTQRLIDPTPLLEANGFICAERATLFGRMVKSEMWKQGAAATQPPS